jgi:hypothetical protein
MGLRKKAMKETKRFVDAAIEAIKTALNATAERRLTTIARNLRP